MNHNLKVYEWSKHAFHLATDPVYAESAIVDVSNHHWNGHAVGISIWLNGLINPADSHVNENTVAIFKNIKLKTK